MQVRAFRDESRARRSLGDIVVLGVREGFDVLRAGFDRRGLDVRSGVRVMGFDQTDVIEEKLVAARRAELASFLEEDANLGSGPVVIVGEDLDDDRYLMRR